MPGPSLFTRFTQPLLRGSSSARHQSSSSSVQPLLSAFHRAPAASLNAFFTCSTLCCSLLSVAASSPERSPLLSDLVAQRLGDLSTASRATLLVSLALSYGEDTAALPSPLPAPFAAVALQLLHGTRGLELTRLKEAINLAHPSLDLHQLVYARLQHAPSRVELLQHFAVQAAAATAAGGGAPLALQVVSDHDDTLRQGWRDARYPRHTRYPGAAALVSELQAASQERFRAAAAAAAAAAGEAQHAAIATPGWWQGNACSSQLVAGGVGVPHGSTLPRRMAARALSGLAPARTAVAVMRGMPPTPPAPQLPDVIKALEAALAGEGEVPQPVLPPTPTPSPPPSLPGTLVVLTARPSGPRGIVRRQTLRTLAPPGIPHVTLLMGSLLKSTSTAAIVGAKLDNFATYRALWPEYAWVLLGDSGQGDAAVGQAALACYGGWGREEAGWRGGSRASAGGDSGGKSGSASSATATTAAAAAAGATAPPSPLPPCSCGRIAAVLIHDVTPGAHATGDGGSKAAYAAGGLHFYHSYAGAALGAWRRGLLPQAALWRVCAAAAAELQALDFAGLPQGQEARECALAGMLGELRLCLWPGVAGLGEEWARAEARVSAAVGAEAAARELGIGSAQGEGGLLGASEKDVRLAAWTGTR